MSKHDSADIDAATEPEFLKRLRSIRQRSPVQSILDWFYGYDYFISYRWTDGRIYALALAEQLKDRGFVCFLDSDDYDPGDNWKTVGERALKNTSILVLVGSPQIHDSQPVERELKLFAKQDRMVPIDIGGALTGESIDQSPLAPYLPEAMLRIHESVGQLATGPSADAVERVHKAFKGRRQKDVRKRTFRALAGTLATLIVIAVFLFARNYYQQTVRLVNDLVANSATDVPSQAATDEFARIKERMAGRRRFVLMPTLENRISQISSDGDNVLPGKKRADLAIALVHLNELDTAIQCLGYPETQAETLAQFAARCRSPGGLEMQQLINLASHAIGLQGKSKNPPAALAAYSALLGIGEFDDEPIPESFLEQVQQWYRDNPSRAVHGACGWLLGDEVCQRLNADLAQNAGDVRLELASKQWLIVKLESPDPSAAQGERTEYLTFILFSNGKQTFAVSDREATVGVCRQLVAEKVADVLYDSLPDYQLTDPLDDVEYADARRECDAQRLCEALGKRFADGLMVQLPSSDQWAIAWGKLPGGEQNYQFGNDLKLLPRYAVCGADATKFDRVAPVGSKRPSMTGMFDVHGNVAEWTIEQRWRGGAVGQDPTLCAWGEMASRPPLVGFRFTLSPQD